MPNFEGTWKMKSSLNFEELLKALASLQHLLMTTAAAAGRSVSWRKKKRDYNQSLATWETGTKIYCKQTLLSGDGPKTFWSRELKGEELELIFGADEVVCTRIYVRA
ncbi:hypothetical protein fugu_003110 [Takifugu bimaculatus]|uniref:Cytosolic fatty-acid binding proteins domain-containing protein n=1 Tax=Takifugu bimaculatus TaxID=433685 RepID=A0A4Z2BEI4_9TELE|nr:hypothetical protein fugu_003110 [Takifugu bimaculatus]